MTDPLVSTDWLAAHLGEVQLVDATWFMPGEGREGHADYLAAHIPGAVFFDIDAIADKTVDLPHMLPTAQAFADAAGQLGLSRDATVVVYDSFGIRSAARVWWTLRVMGFAKVFVLDGGFKKWLAEGRATESGQGALPPTTLSPSLDARLVRDVAAVKNLLESKAAQLVDARGAARFRGETPEPRAGLRSGHMPGARNTPFDSLLNPDGTMKSAGELRPLFAAAKVDLGAPIVTTCGSGVTASVVALALARLGRLDVPVYDGSWTEWGGRGDTAVVTGP
ncbi:MAG: 3-mercaptopyruvate sulfurtransferase [Phenylobacterium sp.]|uniref:3-mercaptopyruvate sulfurtransferase n=1 Tax=Phenylobacterium sp. TaxID=1871053 RepID=UPI003BB5B073